MANLSDMMRTMGSLFGPHGSTPDTSSMTKAEMRALIDTTTLQPAVQQIPLDAEQVKVMQTEEMAKQKLAQAQRVLQQQQALNTSIVQATKATLDHLKMFSPAALASIIARDATLKDLLGKALLLAPAYEPDDTTKP